MALSPRERPEGHGSAWRPRRDRPQAGEPAGRMPRSARAAEVTRYPREMDFRAKLRSIAAGSLAAVALAAHAADANKVLRFAFQNAESSFDPAIYQDVSAGMVVDQILDPMLAYDYLARPVKLVPNTLEAMPEVSSDGMTYTFRLRKGIYFTPDPAFKGKPRELVAADYAYSILRFFDPKVKAANAYLIEDRILGVDDAGQRALKSGQPFDYDAAYPGLQVLDRYT